MSNKKGALLTEEQRLEKALTKKKRRKIALKIFIGFLVILALFVGITTMISVIGVQSNINKAHNYGSAGCAQLEYSVEDMVNLDLAYATTIHKAMGSEYDTVIMPLLKAHTVMLYRNLLYTGITRAKKRVVLIGQKQVLFMAIHRNEIGKRNTLLGERIHLYYKAYARRAGIPVPADLEKELKHAG